MGRSRRTSSGGSFREMKTTIGATSTSSASARKRRTSSIGEETECKGGDTYSVTLQLLECLLPWRDDRGRSLLHHPSSGPNLVISSAWLTRLHQLEHYYHTTLSSEESRPKQDYQRRIRERWMTTPDLESAYTPLHWAVYRGDLAAILLLLRHASWSASMPGSSSSVTSEAPMMGQAALIPPRLAFKPMDMLFGETSSVLSQAEGSCIQGVLSALDHEGMTAAKLLANRQRRELLACRQAVVDRPEVRVHPETQQTGRRRRSSSFELDGPENEQNEFDALHRGLTALQRQAGCADDSIPNERDPSASTYGCEVFTFGQAHHCALGVGQDSSRDPRKGNRPQRVQSFALGNVGRFGGAVAVAAAAHHTLVVSMEGHLYSFGLGKGGRLGTGDESHCPIPARVAGALFKRKVKAVAAAENHSLCVTDCGYVYAWGSNGFGQLGTSSSSVSPGEEGTAARCLPRRVDDLKNVHCVSVAAGAKHSVALTKRGEVYVWGDNSAGQLGISRRNGVHKVQRVEALWSNPSKPKVTVAVAASDQATLVLTLPSDSGLRVNSVYSWGHGNHVPTRVHFRCGSSFQRRAVNPVSISCARFHNVVVTSDGHVYTWGLHAEPLGNVKRKSASSGSDSVIASPQLVTGMLPENGGGVVVGVSASENHTAVITDTGSLFTWGATNGKNILGHEGVRWQPDPKRVPGVYRAVGVVAAKEHTVLLIGTSFPPLLAVHGDATLEQLASRAVAEHVDLFTVIPSLIMAERCQCTHLISYCEQFVRRNLDGVLCLAQTSMMDCYLDEQLMGCLLTEDSSRDSRLHPVFTEVLLAANSERPGFRRNALSDVEQWLAACQNFLQRADVRALVLSCSPHVRECGLLGSSPRRGQRPPSVSASGQSIAPKGKTGCSERCLELTKNMDLSSKDLAETKLACLTKEMRSVRKRLSQISKLEESSSGIDSNFSSEEQTKIARRPQLEADLLAFEPALQAVEKRLHEISLTETKQAQCEECPTDMGALDVPLDEKLSSDFPTQSRPSCSRCNICQISCPDEKSYALHVNGRKHRNRLSQVEREEKESVAACIMEQKKKEQLFDPSPPPKKPVKPSQIAWQCEKLSPQPPYRLPKPPVPVPDSIVQAAPAPVCLRDIMKEESVKAAGEVRISYSPQALMLPKGSAPSLKSPPWATAKTVHLPAQVQTPALSTPAASYALGDFISEPKPAPSPCRSQTESKPAWGGTSSSAETRSTSLRDIQDKERDFKLRQDKTFDSGDGSRKWFVEQRERAASLQDIQKNDEREREMRLFVEDQFRIEKQILEELGVKKQVEEKTTKKHFKPRPRTRKPNTAKQAPRNTDK